MSQLSINFSYGRVYKIQNPTLAIPVLGNSNVEDTHVSPYKVVGERYVDLKDVSGVLKDDAKFCVLAMNEGHDIYVTPDGRPWVIDPYKALIDVIGDCGDWFWENAKFIAMREVERVIEMYIKENL